MKNENGHDTIEGYAQTGIHSPHLPFFHSFLPLSHSQTLYSTFLQAAITMNNNQANNVGVPSLFGHSGIVPTQQPQHPNQLWSHTNNLFSRSYPQTNLSGHFPFSESQSQSLAQAQFAQLQSQAAYAALQSQTQPVASWHNASSANIALTPGTGSSKRATQRTPLRPPGSFGTSQNVSSSKTTVELTPAARRKKRELPEKKMPEKVAALLPESALYTRMLDLEAQIDAALAKEKVNTQDGVRCPPHVQKTLRVYVFNTFSNFAKSGSEKETAEKESSWSLKIIGRILEGGNDLVSGISQRSSPSYPKFSDFFKKVTICLDQSLYPENHVIVWDRARSPKQQDGFEVKRKGDKEFTAVIKIEMNHSPDKFMLSTPLSKILGIEIESPPRIIASLWQYVKTRRLQCPDEPSFFICDPSLQRIFGEEKMAFTMAAKKLLLHLSEPNPIYLEHNIKLSGNCPAGTACYDIQVDMPIPLQKEMSAFLTTNSIETLKEIDATDEAICTSLKKIQEHYKRRAFFLSFSQSPSEFINTMIASQSKDPKLGAGDANRSYEKDLSSESYKQPWVEDAVIRYLNRKTAGSDAPGGNYKRE